MTTLFRHGAAAILALTTLATSFLAGLALSPPTNSNRPLHAAVFAVATMAAYGAHAGGHYVAARRSGVVAQWPYFVPALNVAGTGGVFVKLQWPIDVRAIARIFAAGPIAGFAASTVLYVSGLLMSAVVPMPADRLILGDSLLTDLAQRLVFPGIRSDQAVMIHPLGLAGYFGLFFNLWHVLPIGRLDAGRLAYSAFGYRAATVISWATIGILILLTALSIVSPVWFVVATFGALTMIRIARQHPPKTIQPLYRSSVYRWLAVTGIFLVTFVPVPVRVAT